MNQKGIYGTAYVALAILILGQSACFLPYAAKQGYYQSKLLCGASPVVDVLKRDNITPHQRERLELILAVKQFAVEKLGFSPSSNYSTINLSWDRYIHNVSASDPLVFKPYIWSFPIIGRVPYKGFFSKEDALAQVRELEKLGLDVSMRPVAGYSSLGWFRDPIWPQMLERTTVGLVDLIIHELAHATIYFKHETNFNESFANAVARMGTLEFIKAHFGEHSEELLQAKKQYASEDRYQKAMWNLYQKLDAIYRSDDDMETKRRLKKELMPKDMNNADMMAFARYYSDQDLFERLLARVDHNWSRFISTLRELKSSHDPLSSLHSLVDRAPAHGD